MQKIIFLIAIFYTISSKSQNTVGLIEYDETNVDGYVLFAPMASNETYLIDKCGNKVHEWTESEFEPALSCFLLPDGSLLRTGKLDNPIFNEGGSGGIIERFNWDGTLEWQYEISDSLQCLHHDIKPLPNGNILCIVWDRITREAAIENGLNPDYSETHIWSEKIIELKPIGMDSAEIVWEWKVFDHLVQDFDASKLNYGSVTNNPGLINLNFFPGASGSSDWIHLNSIDYNPALDQILISSHRFCEIWIIDHSTTTSEASTHVGGISGKGGDLLFRWGNPQAYNNGSPANKVFFGQHHATWIPSAFPNGDKLIVFNNGLGRPGSYSSIDIIEPVLAPMNNYSMTTSGTFLPNDLDWSYSSSTPSDFYSSNISGVYPLQNGGFMITSGANGIFFEINDVDETVWKYINPVGTAGIASQGEVPFNNFVFRCNYYPSDFPGINVSELSNLGEVELNPSPESICDVLSSSSPEEIDQNICYPNPFNESLTFSFKEDIEVHLKVYSSTGKLIESVRFTNIITFNTNHYKPGVYYYQLSDASNKYVINGKIIKL